MQTDEIELRGRTTQGKLQYGKIWKSSIELSSASLNWHDVRLERRNIPPLDWPENSCPNYTLSVSLTPSTVVTSIRCKGAWHDFAMHPNSVFVLSANHPIHSHWVEPVRQAMVSLTPEMMQRLSGQFRPELRFNPHHPQDERIQHIVMAMMAEIEAGGMCGRLYGEGLATALAAHLLTNYAVFPATFQSHQRGLGKSDLKRVTDYIQDHLDGDIAQDDLAGLVALSSYHFCRLFKQSTGQSPHQYVIERRVEKAKILLLAGNMTVAQAAVEAGFAHQSHLAYHMKRLLGVTPAQLRREQGF